MKNKKIYILIIVILIIVVFGIIYFKIQKDNSNKKDELIQSSQENIENTENQEDMTINIKSSNKNPIKLDEIEATNIEILCVANTLQVFTTLRNNSNEKINEFFIEMELLDEKGDRVTILAGKVEEIEAKSEIVVNNNVAELSNGRKICNAKILSIEKQSVKDTLESSFEELEKQIQ